MYLRTITGQTLPLIFTRFRNPSKGVSKLDIHDAGYTETGDITGLNLAF